MDWKRGNITAISLWHLWRYSLVFHIYVAIMAFLAMPQISGILGIYGIYGKYGIVPQNPGFSNYNMLFCSLSQGTEPWIPLVKSVVKQYKNYQVKLEDSQIVLKDYTSPSVKRQLTLTAFKI